MIYDSGSVPRRAIFSPRAASEVPLSTNAHGSRVVWEKMDTAGILLFGIASELGGCWVPEGVSWVRWGLMVSVVAGAPLSLTHSLPLSLSLTHTHTHSLSLSLTHTPSLSLTHTISLCGRAPPGGEP